MSASGRDRYRSVVAAVALQTSRVQSARGDLAQRHVALPVVGEATLRKAGAVQLLGAQTVLCQHGGDLVVGEHAQHPGRDPRLGCRAGRRQQPVEGPLGDVPDATGGEDEVGAGELVGQGRGGVACLQVLGPPVVEQAYAAAVTDGLLGDVESDDLRRRLPEACGVELGVGLGQVRGAHVGGRAGVALVQLRQRDVAAQQGCIDAVGAAHVQDPCRLGGVRAAARFQQRLHGRLCALRDVVVQLAEGVEVRPWVGAVVDVVQVGLGVSRWVLAHEILSQRRGLVATVQIGQ